MNRACVPLCKEIECSQEKGHYEEGRCEPKRDKYDSIKNQGKCIDKNAFDIAIKVFVQKYMVLALKEIVSKTVIKTNTPRLEENVSQVCVYLSTNQTLTALKFFHHLGLLSTRQKKHKISRDKFRGESYLRGIFTRNHLLFIFIFL